MPQRNGMRSSRGRSAIARKAQFSGPGQTDGMQPSVLVKTLEGKIIRTSYFGGSKKGGSAPSATGFMRPFANRATISSTQSNPNYFFTFKTNSGPIPFGNSPYL